MTDKKGKPRQQENAQGASQENSSAEKKKKKAFGSLKPLTAIQIISLIVPSSPVGASACY
jgi:hypothetical protein